MYLPLRPALIPSLPVGSTAAVPPFIQVRTIIVQRCAVCHSDAPTMPGVASAPNGVRMDTPEQIRTLAGPIKVRAADERAMPPGNVTGITENERATLKRWVEAGAPIR